MLGGRPTLSMTRAGAQWAAALGCSLAAALALDRLAIPAAFLVGPMATGMLFALRGATIGLPAARRRPGRP